MTEKQEWLKIASRCIADPEPRFLCHDVRGESKTTMHTRLQLFRPGWATNCLWPWWYDEDACRGNECRAIACGFLAAMCDD